MISFSQFFKESSNPVFSEKEKIKIIGIGEYMAKVDSGNDAYCVLHGDNIDINGEDVSFTTDSGKLIKTKLVDTITINVGAGVEEKRPIVLFDIILNGNSYKKVKFSIGNRKDNEEKVLLGLKFLKPLKAKIQL
jgi:hypothetical protein